MAPLAPLVTWIRNKALSAFEPQARNRLIMPEEEQICRQRNRPSRRRVLVRK